MQTEIVEPKVNSRPCTTGFVLVVDDEEPNRTLLRDTLEARGYEVAEATDGHTALHQVADHPPDVILLDLMMPGLNGYEVCRTLKRDIRTAHIPILLVTALSDRKERLMGIEAGANDFLNKPIDLQDITLRVGNAVYTKGLFDQLRIEQEKSERLLLNILPKPIAERMKKGEVNIADHHSEVTVLVADLVGFTALAAHIAPEQIVYLLNEIFSIFDRLVKEQGLEKIKTIGDAYMVAGGISLAQPDHAERSAELAFAMHDQIAQFNQEYKTSLQLRVGINTGPVVAGIIGLNKFAYDLWGDTVNIACRLESLADVGSTQVAEATYERLKTSYRFDKKQTLNSHGRDPITAYRLARCNSPMSSTEAVESKAAVVFKTA